MLDHNFCSLINRPARITDTGATVLDQIWTNSYSDHIKPGICILYLITCLYLRAQLIVICSSSSTFISGKVAHNNTLKEIDKQT